MTNRIEGAAEDLDFGPSDVSTFDEIVAYLRSLRRRPSAPRLAPAGRGNPPIWPKDLVCHLRMEAS